MQYDKRTDNLDNQSVYSKLVPCIQEAKINRQLIIVTHNPNIAVACDAEQIIYCTINKKNNNEIIFAMNSPIQETKAKANTNKFDKTPMTGDSSDLSFWMINAIATIGVIGIIVIIIYRKKNED